MTKETFSTHVFREFSDLLKLVKYGMPPDREGVSLPFVNMRYKVNSFWFEEGYEKALNKFVDRALSFHDNKNLFTDQSFTETVFQEAGFRVRNEKAKQDGDIRKILDQEYARLLKTVIEGEYILLLDGILYEFSRYLVLGNYKIGKFTPKSIILNKIIDGIFGKNRRKYLKEKPFLLPDLENQVFVSVSVKGDNRKVDEIGKTRISKFVDLLNYYAYLRYSYSHRCCINIKGIDPSSWVKRFILLKDGGVPWGSTRVGRSSFLHFNRSQYRLMKSFGFKKSIDLLSKANAGKKINTYQEQILKAITWFSNGIKASDPVLSFFSFMTVLETIYSKRTDKEDRSISDKIAEGVAICLYKELKSRRAVRRHIKRELYDKRSAIVHGGKFEITISDLEEALFYAHRSILFLLRSLNRYPSIDAFTDMLIDRRLR